MSNFYPFGMNVASTFHQCGRLDSCVRNVVKRWEEFEMYYNPATNECLEYGCEIYLQVGWIETFSVNFNPNSLFFYVNLASTHCLI